MTVAAFLMSSAIFSHAQVINVLPTITVVGDADVDFNYFGGYDPFLDPASLTIFSPAHMFYDMVQTNWAEYKPAVLGKTVCAPHISDAARSTTSTSDVLSRWLAAMEVFNYLKMASLLEKAFEAGVPRMFMFNGKEYSPFEVSYADGVKEIWPVNPAYYYSSVKLLDEPFPNSQTPYDPSKEDQPKCNIG